MKTVRKALNGIVKSTENGKPLKVIIRKYKRVLNCAKKSNAKHGIYNTDKRSNYNIAWGDCARKYINSIRG